jgi:hypothetical protein
VAFQRRVFTGFTDGESSPYTLGRPIVAATPDLVEYFETAADTRARLRELFGGEPIPRQQAAGTAACYSSPSS